MDVIRLVQWPNVKTYGLGGQLAAEILQRS